MSKAREVLGNGNQFQMNMRQNDPSFYAEALRLANGKQYIISIDDGQNISSPILSEYNHGNV